VGREWVGERISIKLVMALHADGKSAIAERAGHAQQNITVGQLPAIERNPGPLVHLALEQLGRAGDATAVAAAIGQRDPCRL
jgi:hypothetical protein